MKINDVPCNRITLSNAGLFDSSSSICPLNCLSKRIKLSSPNRSLAFLWNSCGLGALTSLTNNICSVPKTPAANTEVIKSEILHYTEYWLKLWTVIWLAWVFCFKTKTNTCHPLQIGNVSKNYSNTITDKIYTFAFWFDLHTNVYFHKSGFYMWTGDTLDRYFVVMCPDVTMTTCRSGQLWPWTDWIKVWRCILHVDVACLQSSHAAGRTYFFQYFTPLPCPICISLSFMSCLAEVVFAPICQHHLFFHSPLPFLFHRRTTVSLLSTRYGGKDTLAGLL